MNFSHISSYITCYMGRMQKIYLPVMIHFLLGTEHGWASGIAIARRFAQEPECAGFTEGRLLSILNRQDARRPTGPGEVLIRHEIVRRDGDGYALLGFETLTPSQKAELQRLCTDRLERFRNR